MTWHSVGTPLKVPIEPHAMAAKAAKDGMRRTHGVNSETSGFAADL